MSDLPPFTRPEDVVPRDVKWEPLPGTLAREEHENANEGHHMHLRWDGWYECNQCILWIHRHSGGTAL